MGLYISNLRNKFLDSRAEIHQIFALVFRRCKTSKSHSEINLPLVVATMRNGYLMMSLDNFCEKAIGMLSDYGRPERK